MRLSTKINNRTFGIGQSVNYRKAYHTKNGERRVFDNEGNNTLKPLSKVIGSGFVVGVRTVYMECRYVASRQIDEDNWIAPYISGKPEQCLLVVEDIRQRPILVRMQDLF